MTMETLYELKRALYKVCGVMSSDWIPITVNGKKIKSVALTDDYRVEIKNGGIIWHG